MNEPVREPLRVFVNGAGVTVPVGSSVMDAVTAADPAVAAAVRDGSRAVVDSRGLPVTPETPVSGGYVMRVVSSRAAKSAAADDE